MNSEASKESFNSHKNVTIHELMKFFLFFVFCVVMPPLIIVYVIFGQWNPSASRIAAGREVITLAHYRAPLAGKVPRGPTKDGNESRYDFDGYYKKTGNLEVITGTSGIVEIDTQIDDDDTSPTRPVAVTLSDGRHKGSTVAMPRGHLRYK